jgi:hypothetical protein
MLAPEDFMVIQALVKRGVYLCDMLLVYENVIL